MSRILVSVFLFLVPLFASQEKYTIAVCATVNLENALVCKKRIFDNMSGEVFIVKKDNRYFTNLNIYEDKEIAKVTLKHASKYVLDQKPYIKVIDDEIVKKIDKKKLFIDMDEEIKKPIKQEFILKKNININESKQEEIKQETIPKSVNIPLLSMVPDNLEIVGLLPYDIKNDSNSEVKNDVNQNSYEEANYDLKSETDFGNKSQDSEISQEDEQELIKVSMDEFDNSQMKSKKQEIKTLYEKKSIKSSSLSVDSYEEIVIKVDSKTNIMDVFVKNSGKEKKIKTYIVSTGKNSIEKPLGEGKISQISVNPTWYPTEDTKRSFAKRGIILPNVVPPNHKYNYMGLAKLNLTHSVNGNTTYRIHGTLSERTLGTNESAGCIRMKNSEVLELTTIIEEFANKKGLNRVKVILI